ncbi:hypothetical protein MRX96_048311 [Rhipicephalus microplus]
MALNVVTDQQYHLVDQDGTADDQMDQLQGDHDTMIAAPGYSSKAITPNPDGRCGILFEVRYGSETAARLNDPATIRSHRAPVTRRA